MDRERTARVVGVGVACVAMFAAWRTLGWPAPAISAALGFLAYHVVAAER